MSKSLHWAEVDRLVLAHHREDPTSSLDALERYLRKWWCITYERPFKDPLLEQYTLDELAYEFLSKHYLKPENDPDKLAEVKKTSQEDDEWAAKMVQEELRKMQENTQKLAQALGGIKEEKPKKTKKSVKKKGNQQPEIDPSSLPDVISTKFDLPE